MHCSEVSVVTAAPAFFRAATYPFLGVLQTGKPSGVQVLRLWLMALTLLFSRAVSADEFVTPLRLSYLEGQVSLWRPGADDWAPAQINYPVDSGDSLYAADRSMIELQFGVASFVRAAEHSQFRILYHTKQLFQIQVDSGQLALDINPPLGGQQIEVLTAQGRLRINSTGYFRFDATGTASRFTILKRGSAELSLVNGERRILYSNQSTQVSDGLDGITLANNVQPGSWDQWNISRTANITAAGSHRYLSEGVYGAESLDAYGDWQTSEEYGAVWLPRVASTWAPYSNGAWGWDRVYGWTWIDSAPWGWAPFHYGRWIHFNSRWAWTPGPRIAYPSYAPALVAFFGADTYVASVGGPAISWVPLGWGEPVCPWWGSAGWRGRPQWLGWGGPRFQEHPHRGDQGFPWKSPDSYRNARIPHAIVAVDRPDFGRHPVRPVEVAVPHINSLHALRGNLPVRPGTQNLLPNLGQALRPPRPRNYEPVLNNSATVRREPQGTHTESPPVMRSLPLGAPRVFAEPRPLGNNSSVQLRQPPRNDSVAAPQPHVMPPVGSIRSPIRPVPGMDGLRMPNNFGNDTVIRESPPQPRNWGETRSMPEPATRRFDQPNLWAAPRPVQQPIIQAPPVRMPAPMQAPAPVNIVPAPRPMQAPAPQMPQIRRQPEAPMQVRPMEIAPRSVAPPRMEQRPIAAPPAAAPAAPAINNAPGPQPNRPRRP